MEKKKYPYNITEICMTFLEGRRFYATILSKLVKVETNTIPTAGVGFNSNGKLTLYFNPDYLLGLPLDKAQGVLEHEVLHIFFRHLTRFDPKKCDAYNRKVNNLGCDCAINQYIKNLPDKKDMVDFFMRTDPKANKADLEKNILDGAVYPSTYNLPNDKCADFYIDEIKKKNPPCPTCGAMGQGQKGKGKDKQNQDGGQDGKDKEKKEGKGKGKSQDKSQGQDQGQGQGQPNWQGVGECPTCGSIHAPLDSHDLWDKVVEGGEVKDADSNDDLDREYEVNSTVLRAIKECKDFGNLPAFVQRELEALQKELRHNWKYELKLFVNSVLTIKKRLSQKRVNRRFANMSYILPGKKKSRKPRLLLARDTSGSVFNDEIQKEFLNEMISISKFCEVLVADCDTQVHQVYKVKKIQDFKAYKGGGGTSFVPIFKTAKEEGVDGIVYLTDTYGDFPDKTSIGKYAAKTIWVTVGQDKVDVPFGKHVNIPK